MKYVYGSGEGMDSPPLKRFGGVAEGRGWKRTIKMITFDYIEINHVIHEQASHRDGRGGAGRKCPILVPYMET
jgi:hypothetical protein